MRIHSFYNIGKTFLSLFIIIGTVLMLSCGGGDSGENPPVIDNEEDGSQSNNSKSKNAIVLGFDRPDSNLALLAVDLNKEQYISAWYERDIEGNILGLSKSVVFLQEQLAYEIGLGRDGLPRYIKSPEGTAIVSKYVTTQPDNEIKYIELMI